MKRRSGGALPHRGGFEDRRLRALRRTTISTDNRILAKHNYEFLILGPGEISQGRGDEELKGTEQLEIDASGRSSRRALQGQIMSIFVTVTPQGRLQNARGIFPCGFPHHVEDHDPIHHFTAIPTACGVAPAAAAPPRIVAVGGAASHDRKGVNRGRTSTDTGTLRIRCARLQTLE